MSDLCTKAGVVGRWLGGTLTAIFESFVLAHLPVRVEQFLSSSAQPASQPTQGHIGALTEALSLNTQAVNAHTRALNRHRKEVRALRFSQDRRHARRRAPGPWNSVRYHYF